MLSKHEWEFSPSKDLYVTPSQGEMSTQKTPANKITKPPVKTVCKLELGGKAKKLLSHFRCTCFMPLARNSTHNERKAMCNKTKRNRKPIAEASLQGITLGRHEI